MDKAITGLIALAGGAIALRLLRRDVRGASDTADISEMLQRVDDEARFDADDRQEYSPAHTRAAKVGKEQLS